MSSGKKRALQPHEPLQFDDHPRPVSRRDFLARGLLAGAGLVSSPGVFGLFACPRTAQAELSADLETLRESCGIAVQGAGKIPFIAIDLAGGANIAGSNVLIGQQGGQFDFLSTAGYSRLGLPGDMVPSIVNPATGSNDFIDTRLGLAFHSDSAMLRGIAEKAGETTVARINGAVIPARSENDTGNNPHNPMHGIFQAGADGELLSLVGSRNSDSGGNSMAPEAMLDPALRPTKIDRASDVTGLVDTGKLVGLLDQSDAVAVMESIQRISDLKMDRVHSGVSRDEVIKDLVRCGYVKAADLSDRFGDPSTLNPELDTVLVGPGGVFAREEYDAERQFRKTAAVLKLVINGFAGAGTIELGGYDYHTGERATGERRDLLAGRCIGACLEYAARVGVPLMLYVFSDGSVVSNGRIDETVDGRGKGEWTGDNSSTAASFFLVFDPNGRAQSFSLGSTEPGRQVQIGHFRADGSVETAATPAANNVNLLVETVILNYLALHGDQGQLDTLFPRHGLGNAALRDSLTAFDPIVSGVIG